MPLARHDHPSNDCICEHFRFLLTCLLRGMTKRFFLIARCDGISTHMPLARHDKFPAHYRKYLKYFYSHASCEAWLFSAHARISFSTFLLTCLLRGMTWPSAINFLIFSISTHMPLARHDWSVAGPFFVFYNFYSHASCEAWHLVLWFEPGCVSISTHMPLARHDYCVLCV